MRAPHHPQNRHHHEGRDRRFSSEDAIAPEKSGWARVRSDAPIDPRLVVELLEPWAHGRPISAPLFLRGGLMNRNYRVRVGRDDVVLRFYDRDLAACRKETEILRAVRRVVAVPELLFAAADAHPTPFAVLEYVDGISLRDLKAGGDRDAIAEAAYDVGRQLAALGSVSIDPSIVGSPNLDRTILSGPNANARLIEHLLASPVLRRRLPDPAADRVRGFAWTCEELLMTHAADRSIVHGDFNSPNILVRHREGPWRVAAILDWEFAFLGHSFYDIGNFLRYERKDTPRFEPWFSRGLTDGGFALPARWLTMARVADLSALCELLTRTEVPDNVVTEIRDLILATVGDSPA